MRGIAKAVAIGDFRDRPVRFGRIGQIGPRPLQSAFAHIMGEIVAGPFEQFLQITFGNAFRPGNRRRRELGIVEPALDGLANPVQDRSLRRAAARIRRWTRELMHKCEQEIDETVRHRRPFHVGQRLQRPGRGVQQALAYTGDHAAYLHFAFVLHFGCRFYQG